MAKPVRVPEKRGHFQQRHSARAPSPGTIPIHLVAIF
jgi:hypothetical protein